MKKLFLIAAVWIGLSSQAFSMQPSEMLQDPALEARARALSHELRCLVCQGQDIDSSDAAFAKDIRTLVRARIMAGDSDAEVLDYIRQRYGDYVLMRPPVSTGTIVLWGLPFLVLAAGIVIALRLRKEG